MTPLILEMRDKPGGRAYVYEDQGFTYDAGPTIITVPFVLHELAELTGRKLDDYVTIVPCDPYYRINFPDGRHFDYSGDHETLEAEIARFNPEDVAGYRRFLAYTEKVFAQGVHRAGRPLVPLDLGDGQGRARPGEAEGRAVGVQASVDVHQGPVCSARSSRSSRC